MLDNLEDDKISAKKKRKKKKKKEKKNDEKVEPIDYDKKHISSSSSIIIKTSKTKKDVNKKTEQFVDNNIKELDEDKSIKENINLKNEQTDTSYDGKQLGDKIKKEKKEKKKKKKKKKPEQINECCEVQQNDAEKDEKKDEKKNEKRNELLEDSVQDYISECNKIEKNIYETINKETENVVEYVEEENSKKKLSKKFSLIKEEKKEEIIPSNIKYLGTLESNICIINSFQDISSISCEEKTHGSCSDCSFVYQNSNENFNLYTYIKENVNNYKKILKNNLDIYEKKYVEEIISFLENILKLLMKKKEKESILAFQKSDQIQDSQNEICLSNSSEEDNEDIIKNYEKYNDNSANESDEQKDIIFSNNNIGKKDGALSKKGIDNVIRKKDKNKEEENYCDYIKKDISIQEDDQTIKLFKSEHKSQIKDNNINSEIEDVEERLTKILSENQQIDKEPNENSDDIFETIFKFYITDNQIKPKGKKKENIINENDNNLKKTNTEINGGKSKGMMNLELFLTFSKNYKIIKNLLTKNELEKIFINECKGNIYITSKQFKKILIICGQIAFTKPPHKNNYTDTKKIYSLLISWLTNNSPDHQKPQLLKYSTLKSYTFSNDNNKNNTPKSRDTKYNILKNSKSSLLPLKDKYKKK
ncbi:conserved Plasmodium protein, unknown function [Plasmodium vinckei vinckei]|uniref:Uncharacterized protein n=1 Tax=Plasmodium vinckei vinckei TaxID=54757 RepID=A0A449BY32_PLAVN|nr:conserved Plasmodium protein, unknown function [Plasmodium vinckei vinckei]VEV58397.1 conserved Plasmodium protein, unknown function [Plasmodium vinckei vinckei]